MLWIKIDCVSERENVIYMPQTIAQKLKSKILISFGQREVTARIIVFPDTSLEVGNKFNSPVNLKFSQTIIEKLLIEISSIYQMNIASEEGISIGPVVGLLLGEQHYYYHDRYMGEYSDAMTIFDQIGGLFFAFKLSSVDWKAMSIYGLFFNYEENKWKYGVFPLPSVVFRRGFNNRGRGLKRLKAVTGGNVFNSIRFNKWEVYNLIKNNGLLQSYLPETELLSNVENLNSFLAKYSQVILKPVGLSRGRGICIIKKVDPEKVSFSGYNFHNVQDIHLTTIQNWELNFFLNQGKYFQRNYIIQPLLELARINEAPFDIRVVMQKNAKRQWQCSGIECRVAGQESLITNISRGGQAKTIFQAIKAAFGSDVNPEGFEEEIIDIAREYCKVMDQTGQHFGEIGIDIAIDEKRHYWFIEANARPTFNGFKKLDYQNYLEICQTPILYAAALAGFGKKGS